MFEYISENLNDTEKFGESLAKSLKNGDVISLIGDMGAGKTTLVQTIGKKIGVEDYITSPTFSLVNTFYGDVELNHLDLYRMEDSREIESIDIDNYVYPNGISIIEWAERAQEYMPRNLIQIYIDKLGENKRKFIIKGNNKREKQIIEEIEII
ncbi:MAG: tRNA (adenosine(37)-N6)-threonylcarbamoyltransferase complex ATPase subunit type 1 TsaE [Tissierellia bacterium]|nr:tRNA (adenosine(37)-N6)-threonylcarbamoyltransferase complex ATPase subunit type 1 TsaE [Tissierellia bacterium]